MNDKQALINVLNRLTAPIEKHTIQFFNNSNPANPDNKPVSRGERSTIETQHKPLYSYSRPCYREQRGQSFWSLYTN